MDDKNRERTAPEEAPPGFPGYRTRPGRSGLDYIDTARETSHMEGLFLRKLFTGRLRTSNRLYQALMLIGGLALLLPMAASLVEFSPARFVGMLGFSLPMAGVGILLLVNYFKWKA